MVNTLARNWWALALRGAIAIIFGILALIWPETTVLSLVLLFGVYALVDGVFAVISGIKSYGSSERWWAVVLEGVVGILIGLLTFFWPGTTTLVMLYLIAAWAIITGILEIATAIKLRRAITGELAMILSGIASIAFGVLLVLFPGVGAVGLVWLIGAYAIIFGILLIILAFRLRGRASIVETVDAPRAPGA